MNSPNNEVSPLRDESPQADLLRRQIPVRFYDGRMFSVLYAIDHRDADETLAEYGVRAVALPLGRALFALSWFRYPDSTIGGYDEFSVSILASQRWSEPGPVLLDALKGARDLAGFVLHLPVTSELACVGGRELYGFPKVLANITIAEERAGIRAELSADRPILRMRIPIRGGMPLRLRALSTFSVLRGTLLRTHIPLRGGSVKLMAARGATLQLVTPQAAIARTIGRLVGRRPPLAVLAARGFTAALGEGVPVARQG